MMYELIEDAEDIRIGDRFVCGIGGNKYAEEQYEVFSLEFKERHFLIGLDLFYAEKKLGHYKDRRMGVLRYEIANQKFREWYRILDEIPYDPAQEPDDEDDV